jgi:hypothetical protein
MVHLTRWNDATHTYTHTSTHAHSLSTEVAVLQDGYMRQEENVIVRNVMRKNNLGICIRLLYCSVSVVISRISGYYFVSFVITHITGVVFG